MPPRTQSFLRARGAQKNSMTPVAFLILLNTTPIATDAPTDAAVAAVTAEINSDKNTPDTAPVATMPVVSLDTDSPLDMNWTGALTLHSNGTTPVAEQIVIPWWHGATRTINNLDVRVRVVDVWF